MKKTTFALGAIFTLLVWSTAFGAPLRLTIESRQPAKFPIVSKTIEVADMKDQSEISRQAALFALSSEGWGLENLGERIRGCSSKFRDTSTKAGRIYYIEVSVPDPVPQELLDLFGYDLSGVSTAEGPKSYKILFHTGQQVSRPGEDFCETRGNFGVISGGMSVGPRVQCAVPEWGKFYAEQMPVAKLEAKKVGIFRVKQDGKTYIHIFGTVENLPDLHLNKDDSVETEVTARVGDLIISGKDILKVKESGEIILLNK